MANNQAGCVVVSAEWVRIPWIGRILGIDASASRMDTHLLMGVLELDASGVWLRAVVTNAIVDEDTQAPTTMDLLVPWDFVFSVGVWDEHHKRSAAAGHTNVTQYAPH